MKIICIVFIIFSWIVKGLTMQDLESGPIVGLNEQEKKYLLELAKNTIHHVLENNAFPETEPVSEKLSMVGQIAA